MTEVMLVLSTFPEEEVARQIGTHLVKRQYAACVNFLPGVSSVYRWKGEICEGQEVLGLIKTTRAGFEPLSRELRQLHPYDEPEIIAIPVADGSAGYLAWVMDMVRN